MPKQLYVREFKMKKCVFTRYSDSIALPTIIQIKSNLYAVVFKLMKLLPARGIIQEAYRRGEIKNNYTVVDTSSGTFALGMGIVCCELGLRFKIFGDPVIDKHLLTRLKELGGSVHIVEKAKNKGAYQIERLKALHLYLSQNQLSFWANQYDNLENNQSYAIVGELIIDTIGKDVNIVGPVGSGGSTGGIVEAMRKYNVNAELIGVDTFNSILFGQPDGVRDLRGLGNTIMPKNLHHQLYDQVHWVGANDAALCTRQLHKHHALFCGPTSGAAFLVADYLANKNKKQKYAFIAPDEGYRYQNTVYDDQWLKSQAYYLQKVTREPIKAITPQTASRPWSYFDWNRRTLQDVVGPGHA